MSKDDTEVVIVGGGGWTVPGPAGEACSEHDFSIAHGAYHTGIAAAEQAIAARRKPA